MLLARDMRRCVSDLTFRRVNTCRSLLGVASSNTRRVSPTVCFRRAGLGRASTCHRGAGSRPERDHGHERRVPIGMPPRPFRLRWSAILRLSFESNPEWSIAGIVRDGRSGPFRAHTQAWASKLASHPAEKEGYRAQYVTVPCVPSCAITDFWSAADRSRMARRSLDNAGRRRR
jgi:hypothetical protein